MAGTEARFTQQGFDRLKAELDTLKEQRATVREDIREAREQGDLRENYAYHEAKDRQGMIEGRIRELEMRLDGAEVLQAGETLDSVVLGVPVLVRMDGATERTYTIVSLEELDSVEDGASEDSPVGQALLNKKVGDRAEVQGPRGMVRFEILKIG